MGDIKEKNCNTFDNVNGTWETAHLEGDRYNTSTPADIQNESRPGVLQLPKTIQVACSFVPIGVYRPEKYGVFYPLYDDRNNSDADIENGLIPNTNARVNWFNPFDDVDMAGRTSVTGSTPGAPPIVTLTGGGDADVIDAIPVAPGDEDFVNNQSPPVAVVP